MKKILPSILIATLMATTSCSVFQQPIKKIMGDKSQTEVAKTDQPSQPQPQKENKVEKKKKRKPTTVQIDNAENTAVNHPSKPAAPVENPVDPAMAQALNGEWTIQEVHGQKINGDERPYINFESSTGNFYGSNGCNILNGNFTVKAGNKIEFTNVISTMKMCENAPYEYLINTAIDQSTGFILDKKGNESYLQLLSPGNSTPLLVLRRHNLDYLNGAWRVISIDGHRVTAGDMKFVIDIPELTIHGNAGCNIMNGQILIDPDQSNSIQFNNLITTRMMCPDIQQETEFLVALEEVTNCVDLGNGRVALRNNSGKDKIVILSIDPSSINKD